MSLRGGDSSDKHGRNAFRARRADPGRPPAANSTVVSVRWVPRARMNALAYARSLPGTGAQSHAFSIFHGSISHRVRLRQPSRYATEGRPAKRSCERGRRSRSNSSIRDLMTWPSERSACDTSRAVSVAIDATSDDRRLLCLPSSLPSCALQGASVPTRRRWQGYSPVSEVWPNACAITSGQTSAMSSRPQRSIHDSSNGAFSVAIMARASRPFSDKSWR